jgi:HlyD family secretion protein
LRKAEVSAAEANLLELERGYLPEEVAQARARTQEFEAENERLQSEFRRQQNLYRTNVISRQEFEAAQANFEASKARLLGAKENLQFFLRGTRIERIDQAKANLDRAKESLSIAQTRLDYATLFSPISGSVLTKVTEPGEYVISGTPIVTVGNLDKVWLRAYINETDLGKIKLGQKAIVTTDTYPAKQYEGTISFIASEAEFTPKTIQTFKERVTLVYRIKIDIPNPNWELKPGMPADARIDLEQITQAGSAG